MKPKKQKPNYAVLLPASAFQTMPWKNGAGKTVEIAIEPPSATLSAGKFLWRLSAATVTTAGPFSSFPGYERLLTLTEGKELLLRLGKSGEFTVLKTGEVFRFSGDEIVTTEIPRGGVVDLGLIYKRDTVKAQMSIVAFKGKPRSFQLTAKSVFFYAIKGQYAVSTYPGELKFKLGAGNAVRINDPGAGLPQEERLVLIEPAAGEASLVAIEISHE